MARRKTNWTVAWVKVGANGPIHAEQSYGDNIDAAKQALVDLADHQPFLYPAEKVPFSMGIVIGKAAEPRKRAAAKRTTTKKPNGGGTRVDADFFERKEDDGPGATNPLDEEK